MTPERFRTIVAAYGANPRRWPQQERDAAQAWVRRHRDEANALLAESAELDAWLERDTVAPPDRALVARIVATAPKSRSPSPPRFLPWGRGRLWLSGAAFAGIGAAGGLVGALAVSFFMLANPPHPLHDTAYLTTGFGGASADWSGE